MKTVQLQANPRTVIGRTVKTLRSKGVLPITVYGKSIEPISAQISSTDFIQTYKQTGETGLISLNIEGVAHPVLVKNVQLEPVSGNPIHVEFHQVNLKEKIKANIPVELIGESQAVKEKTGTLLQLLDEVEVEALPTDLPEKIEVDISNLIEVNDHILVQVLTMPTGVTLLTDPEIMVVKIGALLAPEPEPVAETEAPVEGEETDSKEEPKEGESASEKPSESPAKE